jgi:general secretion pathway protein D
VKTTCFLWILLLALALQGQTPPGGAPGESTNAPVTAIPAPRPSVRRTPGAAPTNSPFPAFPSFPVRGTNRAVNPNATTLPNPNAVTPANPAAATQPPVNTVVTPPTTTTPGANVPAAAVQNTTSLPSDSGRPAVAPANDIPIAVHLVNTPLEQVLEFYSEVSGRVVLRPATLAAGGGVQITLDSKSELKRSEVLVALDAVLALNNVTMIPYGDKFVKAVPEATANSQGAALSTTPGSELPLTEQFVTQIITLKTARPSEMAGVLQTFAKVQGGIVPVDSSQILVLRDYASNVKRMVDLIDKIDIPVEAEYKLEVIPIKYGKVTDLYETMNSLIYGGGGGSSSFASRGRAGTTPRTGTVGQGGVNNRSSASARYNQNNTLNRNGVNPNANIQPNVAGDRNSFQARANQVASRAGMTSGDLQVLGDARFVADERSNSLLVYATRRDMEMITNIVNRVDSLLQQVLIEAIILEVSLTDAKDISTSISQRQDKGKFSGIGSIINSSSLTGASSNLVANGNGFSYFARYGGSLEAAFTAVATDSKVNVVSRPRLQTSHAVQGTFTIGETVPYVTGNTTYGNFSGGPTTSQQIDRLEINISLDVVPYITPEGLVVMDIVQNFDSRGADRKVGDITLPIVNNRAVTSTLTVRDGDTIMLGGFIKDDRSENKSGVPFLKDIPLIGWAFRSKNANTERKEMIVLMRATVLQTPEKAAFVASEERAHLPGVKQAELELESENKNRMKKVDREWRKREEKEKKELQKSLEKGE